MKVGDSAPFRRTDADMFLSGPIPISPFNDFIRFCKNCGHASSSDRFNYTTKLSDVKKGKRVHQVLSSSSPFKLVLTS